MFTELVYGPLIFSPLCGFPNLDNRVWPTFGHFSAVSQRPPVGCLVFAPHLHQLQQCLFQVPQGNQIKICRWDCGAPHSSNSYHLTEVFALLPLRRNMGNKKLMEKSWWLAAGHILTWHDIGIIDWEFSLENFTLGGLGGVGFRRPCYRICWGYGSAFSGEAGLGASLHSKSGDPGFRFSVPSHITFGQVTLPLKTPLSQSANGPNHSPCASGLWEDIYNNHICEH